MYIKSIDLVGFKSFIDKTRLQLEPGISCVVGPNGSGKSNVSDAVRWVIGEQNPRSLRGQKMEDVIFAGSGKRKAIGMAEVALTIDNSDGSLPLEFSEVTVARRAYRSGESEYLINGKTCRLKDIYNLFVDCGVTSDSFSMVGQGRIHEMVGMKPEERRCLIEEAAGIVRYRNRKREAMRKLDNTQRNLERVEDIVSDLAARVGPLGEQAEKAASCREMTEAANRLEISLIAQNLAEYQNKLKQLKESQNQSEKELLTQESGFAAAEAQAEEIRLEITRREETVDKKQQALFQLATDKEKVEARIGVALAQKKAAEENILRLEKEMAGLTSKDGGFIDLVTEKEADKAALDGKIKQTATALTQQEAALEVAKNKAADCGEQVATAKEEAFDLANQLAQIKNEITYQDQLIATARQTLAKIDEDLKRLAAVGENLTAEKERLSRELKAAAENGKEKQIQLQQVEERTKQRDGKQQELAEAEVMLRYSWNAQNSRLQMLQELQEKYEGYYPGVRALLLAAKKGQAAASGIIGVMAELLEVRPGCETALETALGGALQNIVTKTEKDARDAIDYLKKNQAGRVTLLPLDAIRARRNETLDKVLSMPGVIGRGVDLVKCSKEVRPAAEFLLNNLLVVESLPVANQAARQLQYQCKVVTLEGDMVNPGGAMSGGSREKRQGDLLARKEEIRELARQVAELAQKAQTAKTELDGLKAQEAGDKEERAALRESLRQLEMSRLALDKDLQHLTASAQSEAKERESLTWEKTEQEKEVVELTKRQAALKEELSHWQEINEQAGNNISENQAAYDAAAAALDECQKRVADLRVELARLEQEGQSLAAELKRLKGEKTGLFQEIEEKKAQLLHFEKQRDLCREDHHKAKDELQEMEEQYHLRQNQLNTDRHELQIMEESAAAQEKAAKELRQAMEKQRESLHQQEIKKAKLETEWDNEMQKLRENFGLTYEEAAPLILPDLSRREASLRVRELRQAIFALGAVNMGAIEEYQEVKERYEFLTAQRADLLSARKSLDKVIKEMDNIMNRRFQETFGKVSQEFNKAFVRLFGGGQASLSLTDPENLLETGVELSVSPPGKTIANYNLLSGGEKSLIGIALMFGIFQVRPSPFCVLDEVDSALDEANVDRFGEYLRELAGNTQFLLISHRQGTMEAAQVLWGVTMEEDGISKVVSVKLTDMEAAS